MPALPPALSALERRLGLDEGTLDGPDRARAEDALSDALALVLAEVSERTGARWLADAPGVVTVVILKAARREFENPQGFRAENLGEYGFQVDTASGVYLTGAEVEQIQRAASGRSSGGFVGTTRTPSAYGYGRGIEVLYVTDGKGGDPIPFVNVSDIP